MEEQERVFNDIIKVKHSIEGLTGYVQNDFEEMLEDNTTTKINISFAVHDMNEEYNRIIAELNRLRDETHLIMKKYV